MGKCIGQRSYNYYHKGTVASAFVYRDGMGVLASLIYIHLKNPIFTFNLLPISILTTPSENWGRKVGVIKNLCDHDNGKGVEIVKKHFCNTSCCCRCRCCCCCSVPHA